MFLMLLYLFLRDFLENDISMLQLEEIRYQQDYQEDQWIVLDQKTLNRNIIKNILQPTEEFPRVKLKLTNRLIAFFISMAKISKLLEIQESDYFPIYRSIKIIENQTVNKKAELPKAFFVRATDDFYEQFKEYGNIYPIRKFFYQLYINESLFNCCQNQNTTEINAKNNDSHLKNIFYQTLVKKLISSNIVFSYEESPEFKFSNRFSSGFIQSGNFDFAIYDKFFLQSIKPLANLGYTGNNEIITIFDSSLSPTIPWIVDHAHEIPINKIELNHRKIISYISQNNGISGLNPDHGSHVLTTVLGKSINSSINLALYDGVAKNAKSIFVELESSTFSSQIIKESINVMKNQKSKIALFSFSSLSSSSSSSTTGAMSIILNEEASNNPNILLIVPAGNNNDKTFLNTMSSPGDCKNVLTVGALGSLPTTKFLTSPIIEFILKCGETILSYSYDEMFSNFYEMSNHITPFAVNNMKVIQYSNTIHDFSDYCVVVTNCDEITDVGNKGGKMIIKSKNSNSKIHLETRFNSKPRDAIKIDMENYNRKSIMKHENSNYRVDSRISSQFHSILNSESKFNIDPKNNSRNRSNKGFPTNSCSNKEMVGIELMDSDISFIVNKNITILPKVESSQLTIADFSGRGPNYLGSIKPEIVAPGTNIQSSCGYADNICSLSGTSMASSIVAGSAALLNEYLKKKFGLSGCSSMLLRAMLIASAENPNSDLPDNDWGFGCPNMANLINEISGTNLLFVDNIFMKNSLTKAYQISIDDTDRDFIVSMSFIDREIETTSIDLNIDVDLFIVKPATHNENLTIFHVNDNSEELFSTNERIIIKKENLTKGIYHIYLRTSAATSETINTTVALVAIGSISNLIEISGVWPNDLCNSTSTVVGDFDNGCVCSSFSTGLFCQHTATIISANQTYVIPLKPRQTKYFATSIDNDYYSMKFISSLSEIFHTNYLLFKLAVDVFPQKMNGYEYYKFFNETFYVLNGPPVSSIVITKGSNLFFSYTNFGSYDVELGLTFQIAYQNTKSDDDGKTTNAIAYIMPILNIIIVLLIGVCFIVRRARRIRNNQVEAQTSSSQSTICTSTRCERRNRNGRRNRRNRDSENYYSDYSEYSSNCEFSLASFSSSISNRNNIIYPENADTNQYFEPISPYFPRTAPDNENITLLPYYYTSDGGFSNTVYIPNSSTDQPDSQQNNQQNPQIVTQQNTELDLQQNLSPNDQDIWHIELNDHEQVQNDKFGSGDEGNYDNLNGTQNEDKEFSMNPYVKPYIKFQTYNMLF
ncbi:hypothetical protein TRFO_28872 [Tritrichomonas foetus]|uniref:SWIM-type domain-containing protein n=1 Tax=Tritrichomonas foetus TaxID=1144522 RepID=A0A1J4JX02_9EUKA|nr:hypothetical protein TRFO_28872 [Tritrichomonas foetus]|eukprot:OHT03679.1 hypothetical protein TRFO_28872 [Tritrichomonas foetus]